MAGRAVAGFEVGPSVAANGARAAAVPANGPSVLVPVLVAGAWLIAAAAQATGGAALLHHHALIEDGPPLWVGVPAFLLGWQVMVAAMMLPASLPAVRVVNAAFDRGRRPRLARAGFLGAFAAVWTAFGLLAFAGDVALHHLVDATPWLAARPQLIEGGVLALAGAWQLAPTKRRSLAACRHPVGPPGDGAAWRSAARSGLDHGLDCLGSSWALMLLMFAEGFANLGWMAALTIAMTYETTGRHGRRAASIGGIVLLLAGLVTLAGPLPWAA